MHRNNFSSLLGRALLGNSAFSLLCGLAAAFDTSSLVTFLGIPSPLLLQAVGIALIGYALALFWLATRTVLSKTLAAVASFLDFGWVVGTVVLLVLPGMPFTGSGRLVLAILAFLVAVFGVAQLIGIRVKEAKHG